MSHDHSHATSDTNERKLWGAIALTGLFLVIEVVASFLTGSLALLSDAGHMATDVAALCIAVLAIRVGRRRADSRRTYGYRRLEVLAAALNAAALFLVAGYVLYEAIGRFRQPPDVASLPMLAVAATGLAINALAMRLLRGAGESSLNLRGAYLEVWADFLGSIAVLIGAACIYLTGARWIDPVIAVLIALWVLPRAWTLLRAASNVLLEGTPQGVDPSAVEATLLSVDGIRSVHDLHIWSVTTGMPLLSAHVEVERMDDWDAILSQALESLQSVHQLSHVTLQPEQSRVCRIHCGSAGHSHAELATDDGALER